MSSPAPVRAPTSTLQTSHARAPRKTRRQKGKTRTRTGSDPQNLERAAARLEDAVEKTPTDGASWCLLGATLERLGRLDKSMRAFGRAAALDPENTDIAGAHAVVLSRAGKYREASRIFARIVERRPGSAEACTNLGVAL